MNILGVAINAINLEQAVAERTREMLLTTPWTVHFNFQPSFEKPPLQYWLTGLSLQTLKNRTFAVRIWPLVYLVLTAICASWLAFLLEPSRPWVVPLTVAILISYPLFCKERGLLHEPLLIIEKVHSEFSL